MSIEDQDEEVEEEEEFHEVEEEKHKTSQESVTGSGGDRITSANRHDSKDSNAQDQNDQQTTSTSSSSSSSTPATPATTSTTTITATITETSARSSIDSEETTKPLEIIEPPINEVNQSSTEAVETTPNAIEATATTTIDSSTESSISPVTAATNTNGDLASDSKAEDGVTSADANSQSESSKNVDWANIMLTSNRSGDGGATEDDNTTNDEQSSRGVSPTDVKGVASEIEEITAKTHEKLKIQDESAEVDSLIVEPTDSKLDLSSLDEQIETTCETADLALDENKDQEFGSSEEKKSDETIDAAKEGISEEKSSEKAGEDVEKKELDLDEDVKNPQYIPKKGVFYEHDDRSHDVDDKKQSTSTNKKEEDPVEIKESSTNKKAPVQEKPNDGRRNNRRQRTEADKWNHDLFRDEKQKPKSKTELINAYGYDIRQERSGNQNDARTQRGNNNTSCDKIQPAQENQRSRQNKDGGRPPRQHQTGNRSRETRPRRQNTRNNNNGSSNRGDNMQGSLSKRDSMNNRPTRSDIRDGKEPGDEKHHSQTSSFSSAKRDQEFSRDFKNTTRNDSRGRRRNSRDRPILNPVDDKAPNAMMAPITIWSSEDMAKAEAFKDGSPKASQQQQQQQQQQQPNLTTINQRNRATDLWQQNQPNKNMYQVDNKSMKNPENENRQHYNSRGRYQEDTHKTNQYVARNQYGDRSNQHEWHRATNYSPYNKSNDYIVKTQTFENSRLSQQTNMNRSNNRDLREVLNERRMHGHQNYQPKGQLSDQAHLHQRGPIQNQQMHHQPYVQSQHQQMMHHQPPHMMHPNHPPPQHLVSNHHHHQQPSPQQSQITQQQIGVAHLQSPPHQQQPQQQQSTSNQNQQPTSQASQQAQSQRLTSTSQAQSGHSNQRQNLAVNSLTDSAGGNSAHEAGRLNSNAASAANDLLNTRPIIKTETYTTPGVSPHQQQPSQTVAQHSQNHRTLGGPMGPQQGPNPSASHMVPSHLGASANQAQYYPTSNSSRDPSAGAGGLPSAYHGYMPGGHSVMDTSRYHMTSQQLSDHGYIPSPGQTNVATAPVLHQQGMYSDATVASSAYMAQAGSTLSPTSNIPVTGAGPPPLPPVSYLQHSQYPPPPYSNPYSQPQHNQAPPQSSHAYPPYWSYT